ncbi:cell division protein FtsQ/DivIB [Nocardioides mangrovi]|uniref:Cell division protein FtsQ n=1 Tax=Nocardioides mangrovi TaxID=2874580 RepID=A0ABS7U7M3_9ACTN|nr:FtsQ-type POTRA domain-containing protein [Nocardioides mangrovi]MBZ5736817.1 FtsQ-type POTRA domain-containing protein [Nocardioides mangrovi]
MPETETRPDRATTRTRRRFARRQWARRWLNWKPVLAIVLLLVLVVGGVWLVYFSSFLAVQGVQVVGNERIGAAEVRRAAAVPEGDPLATVDLDRIRTRVEALAAVKSADVSRQWPDQVRIDVTERVAVAVVDLGGALHGMDEDGVVFVDYTRAPAGLPRVDSPAGAGTEALQEGARVVASLPGDLATKVDHVNLETVDEISLVLRDGREVEWGSADESAQKAEVLADFLDKDWQHLDVTVPGLPATK